MKSEFIEKPAPAPKQNYPTLAIDLARETLILFSKPRVGTVLYTKDSTDWKIGDHSGTWDMEAFTFLPPGSRVSLIQE